GESLLARAGPPFLPPARPRATRDASLPDVSAGWPSVAIFTTWAASSFRSFLLDIGGRIHRRVCRWQAGQNRNESPPEPGSELGNGSAACAGADGGACHARRGGAAQPNPAAPAPHRGTPRCA